MIKKYRVLFKGLSGNKEGFKSWMVSLGAHPDVVDRMIRKAPIILKEGLTLEYSARYAKAVRRAGGIAEVHEYDCLEDPMDSPTSIVSFKDFTLCPECGLKQQKRETCVMCGFRLEKMISWLEPNNVKGN